MIASLTPVTPPARLDRIGTESLFKRLDSDGNGRLTVADRASISLSLSPQARARYAEAANQSDRPAYSPPRENAAARYEAVQAAAA